MISGEGRNSFFALYSLVCNLALITRKWSSAIDRKLHASDVETDTDCESIPGDVQIPVKNHTVDVLVNDMLEFVSAGIESIIEDNVTSRFKAEQLASWNLLSRSRNYAHTKQVLILHYSTGIFQLETEPGLDSRCRLSLFGSASVALLCFSCRFGCPFCLQSRDWMCAN